MKPIRLSPLGTALILSTVLVTNLPLHAQTLEVAVRKSVESYPGVRAAQAGVRAAQAEIERARGAWSPSVSLNASGNKIKDSLSDQDPLLTPWLSWSVPINGRVAADETRSQKALEVARHKLQLAQQEVTLQLSESWLAVVRAQRMVQLAQQNVHAHHALLGDIRRMVEIDGGRALDLTQAQVRLDAASTNLAQRESELRQAQERLARFAPAEASQAAFFADYPVLRKAVPAQLDQALAELNSPAIEQARAQLAEMQARVDSAKRLHHPTLDVTLGRQHLGAVTGKHMVASANFSMPLWNGGQTEAGVRAAVAQAEAAQDSLTEAELVVRERLRQGYVEWQAAQTRLQLSQQQRESGARLVQGYREQFRMARRTLLDLLNIQSEYASYQQAHAQAEHDIALAQYRISAALGQLPQAVLTP